MKCKRCKVATKEEPKYFPRDVSIVAHSPTGIRDDDLTTRVSKNLCTSCIDELRDMVSAWVKTDKPGKKMKMSHRKRCLKK